MFQNLHTVVLRRATHLRDDALAALAGANGPRLKVHCLLDRPAKGVSCCADVPSYGAVAVHDHLMRLSQHG